MFLGGDLKKRRYCYWFTVKTLTFAPVKTWIKVRIKKARAIIIRPTSADVIVLWAEATLSGFPPEVRYLNPPTRSNKKRVIPANPIAIVTTFLNIHSNPFIVATPFITSVPSLGGSFANFIYFSFALFFFLA